jgi:cytochrome c biogenesis protein CcmG/thiol:disulfide interchange protein DsbE
MNVGRGLTLAALATALLAACSKPEGAGITIGAPAPAYAAETLAGMPISLDSLRGRVVLLNVWATWCHPCREEIPQLEALHKAHQANGLEVVGVSIDAAGTSDGVKTFMRDFQMTYPVWLDPDERVSARFLTIGVPESFLIDRGGVIRWRKIGPIQPADSSLRRAITQALGG